MTNDRMTNDEVQILLPIEATGARLGISRRSSFVIRHSSFPQCLLLLLIVFCGSGATCNRAFRNPFAASGPPAPEVLLTGSSLDQVVAAVNQNAARVVSYQSNNASITVPGMPGIPLLRGKLAAQQPGRVRLEASTALTGAEVDLGSNDELFWFWVKRNEPPALYFSRHDQFAGSAAQQVMPIEPQWLLDAMGMMQFSPNDRHEGPFPHGDGTLEIRSIIQTRGGQMSKSTVIDARRAWVLEQHVYDPTGTLVASTRARSHTYHPAAGVSLPQTIELRLPAAQLALSIDVGTVQLNQLSDNSEIWRLPVLSGYPQIDLGASPPGAVAPMRSAGSSDWSTFASPAFVGISQEKLNNSAAPQTAVLPPSYPPAPTAFAPVVSQGQSRPLAQPLAQPLAKRLRPGGVPISVEQR